jgi:uncharacterized phage infection (PIP) family protein YhgE
MKRARSMRIATVAVVGVLAAFAGGCGSSGGGALSKADYAKKIGAISKEVKSLQSVGTSGGSASSKYQQLRAGLNKAADELAKLNPPSNVKADNADLVSGFRALANALGPLEKATKDNNAAELQSALTKFQSSSAVQKIQHAISDLNAKGYKGA